MEIIIIIIAGAAIVAILAILVMVYIRLSEISERLKIANEQRLNLIKANDTNFHTLIKGVTHDQRKEEREEARKQLKHI